MRRWAALAAVLLSLAAGTEAAEPESCHVVRMSDPGWSDIGVTTAMAGTVLSALGYQQRVALLGVQVTFFALAHNEIDVFLGNWMPAQKTLVTPFLQAGSVDLLTANLEDGKFTLAVPGQIAEQGVHSFADLARFADRFDRRIYGIDAGSPANDNILRMLDQRAFGLEDWNIVESSEQGMLSQVQRAQRRDQWIVFLAWEPNPMNLRFHITYLDGGDRYFGPDFGHTTINTLTRKGFAAECGNLGRLFRQMHFHAADEDEVMNELAGHKIEAPLAAATYLRDHPDLLAAWLEGVTTRDGRDGLAAVQAALGSARP
jgi:glycine betaine/proline transport system substrate-binding protein